MDGFGWPVVRRFQGEALARIRMPVGGIGTGCVSLGGRGQLVDWQLFNRPSIGFDADSFFVVHAGGGGVRTTRLLEIELTEAELGGAHGSTSRWSGLPRFRDGAFAAAYPFGVVSMSDPDVPVEAQVGAFNPLVPGDSDASGIPALLYRVAVVNLSPHELAVSVCGSLRNVVGARQRADGGWALRSGPQFQRQRVAGADVLIGRGTNGTGESDGAVALAALSPATSHRCGWARRSWSDSLLEFWDDFSSDGQLDEPSTADRVPVGSLVQSRSVGPGDRATFEFVIAWRFPNRAGWASHADGPPTFSVPDAQVGNHYAGRYADVTDVLADVLERHGDLESRTVEFVRSVTESGIPAEFADAALSNLAVLKTPVCFRTSEGTFLGWEGQNDDTGSCHGSCTHVWNYQYALESLFPDLAWTMRRVEFVHALDETGRMSFRAGLPLETHGTAWPTAAADGQMGAVLRLWRTYRRDHDRARLAELWPGVRRAVEFAWVPFGWDADMDGVMEGCQHNTMDVEYYGPSGVNQSWYLAALAAAAALGAEVGDTDFADRCRELLERGARNTDAAIFNGEYYQQEVVPPGSEERIAAGLRIRYGGANPDAGSDDLHEPDLQIGPGCTSDQLVGHTMAAVSGLAVPLHPGNVSSALDAVLRHNHREDLHGHVNHLRTFAASDESALLNCTYPRGGRPERPFPYSAEVWTGLEYTAAVGLLLEGRDDAALRVVAGVRARYDGRRRNPFDEVECGRHYVRSMASWGLVEAWRARGAVRARGGEIDIPEP